MVFLLELGARWRSRSVRGLAAASKSGSVLRTSLFFDIDPEVPRRLEGKYPNVEYLIGTSDQTLPALIDRLQRERAELSFALVDGDHSTDAVRKDIDNLLRFRPTIPFYIVMHDSLPPSCRDGLKQANWAANPHVHAVELDFVSGIVNPAEVPQRPLRRNGAGDLAPARASRTLRDHGEVGVDSPGGDGLLASTAIAAVESGP